MLNTRYDYEYIRTEQTEGWQDQWKLLLEGRFIVSGDTLIEDQNAPIFRLGYTIEEVEAAIGFSGMTVRETEWRESQPDRFQLVDGEWSEIDGCLEARTQANIAELKAQKMLEIQREKCGIRDAGVVVDGILFDTDAAAQGMYTQTLMMMQMNPGFVVEGWKASPGVYVNMDQTMLMSVLMAWKDLIGHLTLRQAEKEYELMALGSEESVYNYSVMEGWEVE